MISVRKFTYGFNVKEVPMALYHPADTDQNKCNQIFTRNYHTNNDCCSERTIQENSQISTLVSPNGNKWVYKIGDRKGQIYEF